MEVQYLKFAQIKLTNTLRWHDSWNLGRSWSHGTERWSGCCWADRTRHVLECCGLEKIYCYMLKHWVMTTWQTEDYTAIPWKSIWKCKGKCYWVYSNLWKEVKRWLTMRSGTLSSPARTRSSKLGELISRIVRSTVLSLPNTTTWLNFVVCEGHAKEPSTLPLRD